jgi:hypothetical protein
MISKELFSLEDLAMLVSSKTSLSSTDCGKFQPQFAALFRDLKTEHSHRNRKPISLCCCSWRVDHIFVKKKPMNISNEGYNRIE